MISTRALAAQTFALMILLGIALGSIIGPALAQSALSTVNKSQKITTGNTFQSVTLADNTRRMVQIQNNNTTTDNCWVNDDSTVASGNTASSNVTVGGVTMTTIQASILLQPGQAYTRYYPYVPDGPIVATCANTGDSLYVGIH